MQSRLSETPALADTLSFPVKNKKRKKAYTRKSAKKVKKELSFTMKLKQFTPKQKKAILLVRKKISNGHLDLTDTFMALSPKQKQIFGDKIQYYDKTYGLPLHTAIQNGLPLSIIQALIAITPLEKIMGKDNEGNTFWHFLFCPFELPRKKNQWDNLHFLLHWGKENGISNVMESNLSGTTPIENAMKNAIDPVALRLLDLLAPILTPSDIQKLFDFACSSQDLKPNCLKKLLTMGATINASHHPLFASFVKTKIMGYKDRDLKTVIELLQSAGLKISIHPEYFQSKGNLKAKQLIINLAFKNLSAEEWPLLEETIQNLDRNIFRDISFDLIKKCLDVNPEQPIQFKKWKNIAIQSISKDPNFIPYLVKQGFSLTQWIDEEMRISLLDYIAFYSNHPALKKYLSKHSDTMALNVFHRNLAIQAILGAARIDDEKPYYLRTRQEDRKPKFHAIRGIHFIKYMGIPDIIGWSAYDYAAMIESTSTRQYIFNQVKRQIENFYREFLSCIEAIFPDPLIGLISEYIGIFTKPGSCELVIDHYQLNSDKDANRLALQWAQDFIKKIDLFGPAIQVALIAPLQQALNNEGQLDETPSHIKLARDVFLRFNLLTFFDHFKENFIYPINHSLTRPERIKEQFTLLTTTPINPLHIHYKTSTKKINDKTSLRKPLITPVSLSSNPLRKPSTPFIMPLPAHVLKSSESPYTNCSPPEKSDVSFTKYPYEMKTMPTTNALSTHSIFSSPIVFPFQIKKDECLKWLDNLSLFITITDFESILRPYIAKVNKIRFTHELDILINDMSATFNNPFSPLHQMAKRYGNRVMEKFKELFDKHIQIQNYIQQQN